MADPDPVSDLKAAVRRAVADYVWSEGCSCCEDRDAHEKARQKLGELLDVPLYADGSCHDFGQFRSKEKKRRG